MTEPAASQVQESRTWARVSWAGGARYDQSLPGATPADRRPRARLGPGGPNSARATRLHPHETDEVKRALEHTISPAVTENSPSAYRLSQLSILNSQFLLSFVLLALGTLWAWPAYAQDSKHKLFERVFGDAVKLDPTTVAKVKAMKPGERFLIDRDGDGKNDEVWYVDTAARHTDRARPLLVRAIDEDGDLDHHRGPDLDSDLYVADFQADGTVDVVLDYQDNDGDNDLDEMAFYFWMAHHPCFGSDVLRVWWGSDDGDDNLLWYDVNYNYYQNLCQYRCHFSGDESFVAFGLKADGDCWLSAYENPFLFYDPDGDRCSEVVLRIEGQANRVQRIRYSFDVDDDACGRRTHDYDFSITAIVEEGESVELPLDGVTGTKLCGIPTQPWLHRKHARDFVARAPWARAVLTWDEMNANTEANLQRDPHERWEGIINHSSPNFPQVGGPPCSPLNKRNEVSLEPAPPLRLYYDPTDHRLHLKGANEGWLHVDYDFDGTVDAKYTYIDDDRDGAFDRRQLDLDADGRVDLDWKMEGSGAREFDLEFARLTEFYKPTLAAVLADSRRFIDAAKASLIDARYRPDPVETFFLTKLESWMPATGLGKRMRETPAGARFYVDLLRDRLFLRLKNNYQKHARWHAIEQGYAAGDYRRAARIVGDELVRTKVPSSASFRSFTHRVAVLIDNTGSGRREDWPIALAIVDLRKAAGDFNPDNCAVVAPERWIDWRQIPHQIDEIDPAVGREISLLIDLPADAAATYFIYYSPTGKAEDSFKRKTGTAEDWVPPNIGWESNRVAYRAYWGQFDFFGKKIDRLIYDDIGATSYHSETDWGIDALHVGKTSGLGGLTLYEGDHAYLVQNPAGEGNVKFTKRVLTQGPVRCAVEITASNVVPDNPDLTVRMLCLVYAERQEAEIRARVTGAAGEVLLAPGLVKLPREQVFADPQRGCLGTWGYQEAAIDEIGMSLFVPPDAVVDVVDLPEERRVRCRTSDGGRLRYWVIGDWRRGRRHPIAPTVDNWRRESHTLAGLLLGNVRIEIGEPHKVR